MISGRTDVYGILGWPVGHSLSPQMHNAAFNALGINAVYVPFPVRDTELEQAVAGIRSLNIKGCNVTIPHKQNVCAYLDEITDDARLIGAVNTIVREGESLIGYNTDASGFLRSLQRDLNFFPQGKKILILGAGGAARGCIYALAQARAEMVFVANRTLDKSRQLCAEFSEIFPGVKFAFSGLEEDSLRETCQACELIVNTTSLGLHDNATAFLPWEFINSNSAIYDVVYKIGCTQLVQKAIQQGFAAVDGLGMLIAQGEEAFKLWTGVDPEGLLQKAAGLAEHNV